MNLSSMDFITYYSSFAIVIFRSQVFNPCFPRHLFPAPYPSLHTTLVLILVISVYVYIIMHNSQALHLFNLPSNDLPLHSALPTHSHDLAPGLAINNKCNTAQLHCMHFTFWSSLLSILSTHFLYYSTPPNYEFY